MSHVIIDRRLNDRGKSTVNRSRYLRRVKDAIKESVREMVRDGNIDDTLSNKDKNIKIKRKSLDQPTFYHKTFGGIRDHVYPGNEEFVVGDKIARPRSDGGPEDTSKDAGDTPEEFEFTISQQEFLDIFFENLYLPDLVRKDVATIEEYQMKRAGFTVDGNPSRLNIVRSMKQSMSRTIALVADEEEELERLEKLTFKTLAQEARIKELKGIIKSVPFIDDMDLRYNRWEKTAVPSTQAVVFGLRDASGSMGEWERDMTKRFFVLMILFLKRKYEKVVFVPIVHNTMAREVTEQEFFAVSEGGGTIISSAYGVMDKIQKERFPKNNWNIFGVQISDGDNESRDVPVCVNHLKNVILPISQYFAYVETKKNATAKTIAAMFGVASGISSSETFTTYSNELKDNKNFVASVISDAADIYPVFRKLFEKKNA